MPGRDIDEHRKQLKERTPQICSQLITETIFKKLK